MSSTNSLNSPRRKPQPICTCLIKLCDLYCVTTPTRRMPELMQLDRGKSMIRNLPPNGTAGFARQLVSSRSLLPRPPASINASVFLVSALTKRDDVSCCIFSSSLTTYYDQHLKKDGGFTVNHTLWLYYKQENRIQSSKIE